MPRMLSVLMLAFVLLTPYAHGEVGAGRVYISVSVGSLASIVRDLCGNSAEIHVVVPDGVDPHSYNLNQEDYDALERADLLVLADPNEFEIEAQIADAFPDKPKVDFSDYAMSGASLHPLEGLGDENFHGYWMYPTNAIAIARALVKALSYIDPMRAEYYRARLSSFRDGVDRAWSDINETAEERGMFGSGAVVALPGAAYVAETLGLRVRGTMMKAPGVFVSGSEMDELVDKMRRGEVRYVVCPEEMRGTSIEDGAVELASRGGAQVIYVRAFTGDLGYLNTMYYNLGSAGVEVGAGGEDCTPWILAFLAAVGAAVVEGAVILRFRREVIA